ncbi:MAG: winged helix-turn-helix transcriptional regulator [bacterium]|nr:winged helix-turn-helix transcriptional regulator [bacterium]
MVMQIEQIFKALGDKNRLRILNMLTHEALCVCEITKILNLSQSTVSGHLRVLRDAGIVEDKKEGLWVEYRLSLASEFISDILDVLLDKLRSDPRMRDERAVASSTDRKVLCRDDPLSSDTSGK